MYHYAFFLSIPLPHCPSLCSLPSLVGSLPFPHIVPYYAFVDHINSIMFSSAPPT